MQLNLAKLRCNVSFSLLDRIKFDTCQYPLQFGWLDNDVLAIGASKRSLETASLEPLHPNDHSVDIPVHELDSIATSVEEHEQSALPNIELIIILDDSKESIKTLASIDRINVKIDLDRRSQRKHLGDLVENRLEGFDRIDWDEDGNSTG